MTAPTLALNISAPGADTVIATAAAVKTLREELAALKSIAGSNASSGLDGMREMVEAMRGIRSDLIAGFAGIKTAITENLTKDVPKAFQDATQAQETASNTYLQSIKNKSALMTTAFGESIARLQTDTDKEKQSIQNRSAIMTTAYAEAQAKDAQSAERALQAIQNQSALMTTAYGEKLSRAKGAAERERQSIQNRSALLATTYAEAQAKETQSAERALQAIQNQSALMTTAYGEKLAKIETTAERERQLIQNRSALMTTAYAEAQAKETASHDKWIASMNQDFAKFKVRQESVATATAAAITAAAEKEAAAIVAAADVIRLATARRDAAYSVMDERGKLRSTIGARAELDQKVAIDEVTRSYGSMATAAAQAGTSLGTLQTHMKELELQGHKLNFSSAGVVREYAIMTGETIRGNFNRLIGSVTVLANRTGIMQTVLMALTSGLGAATAVATAFAGVGIALIYQHEKEASELQKLQNQLEGTGRAMMFHTGELKELIHQTGLMPGMSKEMAIGVVEAYTKVKGVGHDMMVELIGLTADFAAGTGLKATQAAKELAGAMLSIAHGGAESLDKAYNVLSASQLAYIEQMVREVDLDKARATLMDAAIVRFKGLAEKQTEVEAATHKVKTAWDGMNKAIDETGAYKKVDDFLSSILTKFAWIISHKQEFAEAMALGGGVPLGATGIIAGAGLALAGRAGAVAGEIGGSFRTLGGNNMASGSVGNVGGIGTPEAAAADEKFRQHMKDVSEAYDKYRKLGAATDDYKRGIAEVSGELTKAIAAYGEGSPIVRKFTEELAGLQEKLNKKEGKGAAAALRSEQRGDIEELKMQAELEGRIVKHRIDEQKRLYKEGVVSKLEEIDAIAALELRGLAAKENALQGEIVIAGKIKNNHVEEMKLQGQMSDITEDRANVERKRLDEIAGYWEKNGDNARKAQTKEIEGINALTVKMKEHNDAVQIELSGNLKLKDSIDKVTLARAIEKLALLKGDSNNLPFNLAASKDEIDSLEAYITEATRKVNLDARLEAKKTAEHAQKAWETTEKSIETGLYDAIGKGGGNGFKKLMEDVKSWFARLVLQPIISPIAQMGASFLNPGAAGAGGNMGSSLFGAANTIGNLTQGGGFLGSIGTSLGINGATNAASAGLATAASMAGGMPLEQAVTMIGSTTTAIGGLVSTLGAALPWVGAALLAYQVFGGKGGGPKTEGGFSAGLNIGGIDAGGRMQGSERGDVAAAQGMAKGISDSYRVVADALGLMNNDIKVGLFFSKDPKGTSQSQLQVTSANYNRGTATGGIENVGRSDAEFQAAVALAASQLILSELKSSNLSGKVGDYIKGLDPAKLSAEQINSSITLATNAQTLYTAFGKLGPAFSTFSDLSVEGINKIVQAGGGMARMSANLSAYYDNFYSDAEKMANTIKSIQKVLKDAGVSTDVAAMANAPDARKQFRDLMESMLAMGPAGNAAVQALLSVSGAFASVTKSAAEVVTADAGLVKQEMQLLGDVAGLRKMELLALTPANAAIQARIWVLQDEQVITGQRLGLQKELMQLLGDTAGLRKLELDGLDKTNRALKESIFALQDEAAAKTKQDAANAAAASAAAAAQQQYNSSLAAAQQQMQTLTNNIKTFIAGLNGTSAGANNPEQQLASSKTNFEEMLAKAKGGDKNALDGIIAASQQYINAGRGVFASGTGSANIIEQVKAALEGLPAQVSATQQIVNAINFSGGLVVSSNQSGAAAQVAALAILQAKISSDLTTNFITLTASSNGRLNFEQFSTIYGKLGSHDDLLSIFMKLDTNHTGFLNATDIARLSTATAVTGTTAAVNAASTAQVAAINGASNATAIIQGFQVSTNAAIAAAQTIKSDLAGVIQQTSTNQVLAAQAIKNDLSLVAQNVKDNIVGVEQSIKNEEVYWLNAIYGATVSVQREVWNMAHGIINVQSARTGSGDPHAYFADGAAFTNGVVSQPTSFNIGKMGESGSEAIMPLTMIGGKLGVATQGGTADKALIEKVDQLIAVNKQQAEMIMQLISVTAEGGRRTVAGISKVEQNTANSAVGMRLKQLEVVKR